MTFRSTSALFLPCLAALSLLACRRQAPPISPDRPLAAAAVLSTNSIRVGEPIELRLTIEHPAGSVLQVPEIGRGKDLIVRDRRTVSAPIAEGRTRTQIDYQLTSLVVGPHSVSTGMIQCTENSGQTLMEPFPPQSFEVQSALTGTNATFRAIKGLARWPGAFPRWIPVLLGIAVLAGIAGMLAKRFLTRPRTILHYPPPTPAHELALRQLRDLRGKGWMEEGKTEPFYVALSGIVRHYLENRFRLRAPERTTEEFIRDAAGSRLLSGPQQQVVRDFLEQSDLVKFARHHPGRQDMETAYNSAEHLVIETAPAPEPAGTKRGVTP